MSIWEQYAMEARIANILDVQSHKPTHHFGRPFLTPYQIAIEFRKRFPQDFEALGKPLGGKGTGQQDSIAQYIALELSKRIHDHRIINIEGRFLHRANLLSLQYEDNKEIIESSSMQSYDLSMFRLIH
ncbi:MAG: hypothetical protein ACXV9T_13215 [Methylobacter sp.]